MENTDESVIQFGRVIGLRDGEIAGVLAIGYGDMHGGKNDVENIRSTLPTHNLRDIYLGAALYAAMLDNGSSEISAMLAEVNRHENESCR